MVDLEQPVNGVMSSTKVNDGAKPTVTGPNERGDKV